MNTTRRLSLRHVQPPTGYGWQSRRRGDIGAVSIKNARSSSTQVVATLNKFRGLFNVPEGAMGVPWYRDKNRSNFNEIPTVMVENSSIKEHSGGGIIRHDSW